VGSSNFHSSTEEKEDFEGNPQHVQLRNKKRHTNVAAFLL